MSNGYMTLMGAEQVQQAARSMQNAADQMQRAASEMQDAVRRQGMLLEQHEINMRNILNPEGGLDFPVAKKLQDEINKLRKDLHDTKVELSRHQFPDTTGQ